MNSTVKKGILILIIVSAFGTFAFGYKNSISKSKGVLVGKWDNIYTGTNIKFYNEDLQTDYLKGLSHEYELLSKTEGIEKDMDKALKMLEWTHEMFEFNRGSISGEEDAKSIINALKDGKKASDQDMSIVFTQTLRSVGVQARVGVFKVKDGQFNKKASSLYISEIWSKELNKWVAIDVANNACFYKEDIPLSAIELLKSDIDTIEIKKSKNLSKYKKEITKYLYSYSIPIDNSFLGVKKSNSFIRYIPEGDLPEIKGLKSYENPSLYVNSSELFEISPYKKYSNAKIDDKATFIIMKKDPVGDKNEELQFVVGAFKDSSMVKEYYASIDGMEYYKVNQYFDLKLKIGENKIILSEDGKTPVREIIINYKK